MLAARIEVDRGEDVRLLVVDPAVPAIEEARVSDLPARLAPGDLLVVNDAATLPASLRGQDQDGRPVELRLVGAEGEVFRAAALGAGDWRQRTEDRPPPPPLPAGTRLRFGGLGARVLAHDPVSPRLLRVAFDATGDQLWAAIYREGRPVQYSHARAELPLWAVQTVYAGRPWAFEMPSAGRPLSWEILLALRRRGVRWAALTHAAGLSATGDLAIDAALPLPERYELPAATAAAVDETRAGGGRVLAVGTTVVRALEGAAVAGGGTLRASAGVTDLRIGPAHRLRVVDGILTGVHAPEESHFDLLGAFAGPQLLRRAWARAHAGGFRPHELGDAMLVLPGTIRAPAADRRG
jgi:S-adenosylmethionine:tRNA ribosyltransferase-isomerase